MRIVHEGFSQLRFVDDEEHHFFVDPHGPVEAGLVLLSGGPWAERYTGVQQMDLGASTVVGSDAVLEWVRAIGPIGDACRPPCEVRGVRITAIPYTPKEPRRGTVDRVRAAARRPQRALERLRNRRALPEVEPLGWRIEVPHGHTIVHLGLALHADTPSAFLAKARHLCEGATAVIAGYPTGDGDAFEQHVVDLAPQRLLLMDQSNDLRRDLALPAELITPVRDRLHVRGLETHNFVSGTSIRFEENDTIKRW